jgi:16S rRNA (guanine527-N7)-methyltransferase
MLREIAAHETGGSGSVFRSRVARELRMVGEVQVVVTAQSNHRMAVEVVRNASTGGDARKPAGETRGVEFCEATREALVKWVRHGARSRPGPLRSWQDGWVESSAAEIARRKLERWPEFGLEVPPSFWSKSGKYAELLAKFGRSENLTGSMDALALGDHIVEGLLVAATGGAGLEPGGRWLDVGSGAGLPGLVVALALPGVEMTLVEPREKRGAFLEFAREALQIASLGLRRARLEDSGFRVLDGQGPIELEFDVASSRATFPPETWLRRGLGLVRPRGVVLLEGHAGTALVESPATSVSVLERGRWRVEAHVSRET